MKSSPHSLQLDKAHVQQRRPSAAKKKKQPKTCNEIAPTQAGIAIITKNTTNTCWEAVHYWSDCKSTCGLLQVWHVGSGLVACHSQEPMHHNEDPALSYK